MRREQIALQLYTVRSRSSEDFVGTLRAVAEMGYPAVEFAGFGGLPVSELRSRLDELGLKAPSAHVPYASLLNDPAAICADLRVLGAAYAVVPIIGEEHRGDIETARRFVASLNTLGEAVRAEGLRFAYHNHAVEFAALPGGDGTTLWDVLLADTDPALVALELDFYWAAFAGQDALALLKRDPARFPLLHFKDITGEGDARRDAPVGHGSIAWEPFVAVSEGTSQWFIVEQDTPDEPLPDVERSLRAMERLAG